MQVDPADLVALYDHRYSTAMQFQTSPLGLHSVIASGLAASLAGREVLDIGCGAGRLALFCAARGARVTALDFSPKAIALARHVADSLEVSPGDIRFDVGRFEELDRDFDIVLMAEVFEHIPTPPPETLRQLHRLVRPGGVAVVSSPGFVNFRGVSWMTLQSLFGFLMSPSDVHFIQPWEMAVWCRGAGFAVDRHLGMFHDWGWGGWATRDMTRRIRLALEDQRRGDPRWADIPVDLDRMNAYLEQQGTWFQQVLDQHVAPHLSHSSVPQSLRVRQDVRDTPHGNEMATYLADASVPYADAAPLNALGATNIFFCRRPA